MTDAFGDLDHLLGSYEQVEDDWTTRPVVARRAAREPRGASGFVAGTPILTPQGALPVQTLRAGDLVMTCDNGFVPLVRVCQRPTSQLGIDVGTDAMGRHGALVVAERQLVLLRSSTAQLCFGATEVAIEARALVNDHSICRGARLPKQVWCLETERQEVLFVNGLRLLTSASNRQAQTARMVLTQAEGMILSGTRWTC